MFGRNESSPSPGSGMQQTPGEEDAPYPYPADHLPQQQPVAGPGGAMAPGMQIAPQPWVRELRSFLGRVTYGSLRVDLARPTYVTGAQRQQKRQRNVSEYDTYGRPTQRSAARLNQQSPNSIYFQPAERVMQGARVKVMRCMGVGPVVPFSYCGRRAFDAGIGVSLDLDGSGISPSLRLRILEAVRLHVLPQPVFKLKHALPIFDTGLALHATYYQPLNHGRLRHIGRSGAWNLSLGRVGANQVIVSPDRVELSNTNIQLGRAINLHLNGEIAYPRYVPHPDWADQFNFLPTRVCLKADW